MRWRQLPNSIRCQRARPVVLISPREDGTYAVSPQHVLSTYLGGLADVVAISPQANSFKVRESLGERYAAWRGAINVILPPHKDGNASAPLEIATKRISLQELEPYASEVDFFILDGALPGSGQRIAADIPAEFPYPFLLAGGVHEGNLDAVLAFKNCIGVDIASGIETEGKVDLAKIERIAEQLAALPLPVQLPLSSKM